MKQETSKKALLEEITQVGFAVDEMTLYLDTHPYETEAIDYLTYYVRRKNQLMKEYAYQYGPLTIVTADHRQDVWNWALLPIPDQFRWYVTLQSPASSSCRFENHSL